MDYSNQPNVNYMPSIPSYRPFMTGNGDINTNEQQQQPWEQQEKYVSPLKHFMAETDSNFLLLLFFASFRTGRLRNGLIENILDAENIL